MKIKKNIFKHCLQNFDMRIDLVPYEYEQITILESEIDEIEQKIFSNQKKFRTLKDIDPLLSHQINQVINELFHEYNKKLDIAYAIQLIAEDRFIINTLNGDTELILFDAKENLKNLLSLEIKEVLLDEFDISLMNQKEIKGLFKRYVLIISYQSSRIHRNYCKNLKLTKCIDLLNKHTMNEARKKFKIEYDINIDYDFSVFRYNKNFAALRKPDYKHMDPMKRYDTVITYELNEYSIEFREGLKYLDYQCLKFIDYLSMLYYDSNIFDGKFFRIPLNHYMNTFNLKASRNAKAQVLQSIEQLRKARIKITNNIKNGNTKIDSTLIGGIAGYSNNLITIETNIVLNEWFRIGKPFTAPNQLFRINTLVNPHSYPILKKITEHKNMNRGAANEDILRVRTLLEECRELPRYRDIEKSGQIDQRIKKPFFRDLDVLSETLSYEIINKNSHKISTDEARELNFEEFENLRLKLTWKAFPERKKVIKELS